MLCGVKRGEVTSRRRRALSCISNSHRPLPKAKPTTPAKSPSHSKRRVAVMDKENAPVIGSGVRTGTRRCKDGELLPQALAQLRLAGEERAPLDRHTARRLINKHFSGVAVTAHAQPSPRVLGELAPTPRGHAQPSENMHSSADSNNQTQGGTSASQMTSQKSLNCSSIPTVQQSHIDLRSRSDTTLRQPAKRCRTESANDVPGESGMPGGAATGCGGRAVSAGNMCAGKRRAVAIASHLADRYGLDARGLLKVRLSAKDDHITVQVEEAAELQSSWSALCSAFVKVEVCPSISSARSVQTSVQEPCNHPRIQQTLTVETCAEDLQKRLVVSVWHADPARRCSEFVGCLSFGIRHLACKTRRNQAIGGWYYILPEHLGHRKHILAQHHKEQAPNTSPDTFFTDQSCTLQRPITEAKAECTHAVCEKDKSIDLDKSSAPAHLDDTNSHNLLLKTVALEQGAGYGFTLHSTHPVTVSRVRPRTAAHAAGIHAGDVITAVNQRQVHAHTAKEVATLVRQSGEHVTLDILCPHYTQSMQQYLSNLSPKAQGAERDTPQRGASILGTPGVSRCISENNVLSPTVYPESKVHHKRSKDELGRSQTYSVINRRRSYEKALNESVLKWDPSLSHISVCSQTYLQYSQRNDSFLAAVSPSSHPSLHRVYDASPPTDSSNKENSPRVKPTMKKYSTFSLATEAEVVSTGGESTPRRRKRVVRRRLGCKKRLPLSAHVSPCQPCNSPVRLPPAPQSLSVNDRVSIVPYGNDADDSDSTMYSELDDLAAGHSRLEMSSYGTQNAGFMSTDTFNNSILSCTLESDYYSDSLQTSPGHTSPLRLHTTPCNDPVTSMRLSASPRPVADGESLAGSVDEVWVLVSPRSQDALLEGLCACEQRFTRAMSVGFRKYLWPARTMLSAQCFRQIFNNIEKLAALSQFLMQQMSAELSDRRPLAFQTVLQLYANKLPLLVEAYGTYRHGYDAALRALQAAKLHTLAFQQFVQHACAQPPAFSLDDLLLFPLHHVAELVQELETVHARYPEHEHLAAIVQELGQIIEGVDLEQLENTSSCAPSEVEQS